MLHIVLTLLKIIVFFLLALLGILLVLVAAVLASPVSYDFSGGWDGKPHLKGRVYWLYHIVRISVTMKNGQLRTRVSLFGRPMGANEKAEHKEEKTVKKKPELKHDSEVKHDSGPESTSEPGNISELKIEPEAESEWKEIPDSEQEMKPDSEPEPEIDLESEKKPEPVHEMESRVSQSEPEAETEVLWDSEFEVPEEIFETEPAQESAEESNSVFSVIRSVLDFINLPSVRSLLGKLRKSVSRIIRHLRPSDLRIRATVGTDDPALTGRIMELAAVLYAFYGDHIEIVSDFNEKVLEAAFSVKGRLIPGYLIIKILGMALRILLNRECRAFYREIKENLT